MLCISVIIPVYNVERYVRRCLMSIIEQENCGANLECIIIDDCSPDNSMEVILSLIEEYHGDITFTILKHEYNKGLSAARNTGIDAAHGDYVFFVDSDDYLPANSISKFVKVLRVNPDLGMIAGFRYNTREKEILQSTLSEPTCFNNYLIRKLLLNYQYISCSAWNKLIKNTIIANNKFPEGIIYEDKYWAYFLFKDISQAIVIPDITYIYENDHPLSIVNTAQTKQKAPLYLKSISVWGNELLNSPYMDLYADSLIYLLRYLIIALDLQKKYKLENEDGSQIKRLRKRLVTEPLKNRRWFLALFIFILTYPPFSYLLHISWVRHHYLKIEDIGKVIANFFEKFHTNTLHITSGIEDF